MKIRRRIYIIVVMLTVFFTTGAGVEDDYEEYAYYAESEERAQEIADELDAQFVSYCHGIASLRMHTAAFEAEHNVIQKNTAGGTIKLYPELLYTVDFPTDQAEETQWHLNMVNVPEVWDITMGKGIKVAVLDTGIDDEHEDLRGAVISSTTVIPDESYGNDSMFPEEYRGSQDNLGHGTHVAGVIGARRNEYGCTGIAPECKILSIKALEKGSDNKGKGKSSWVAAAVLEAVEADADIINLSVGGSNIEDELLYDTIKKAYEKGIVIVCAAGNAATSRVYYPAGYRETISVSAVRKFGNTVMFASSYSNYGDWIDICAPGSSIMSTIPGGYGEKTGTSMACPVVSGIAALLLSVESSLTPAQVMEMIEESAVDLGAQGKDDKYGYGMVDAKALLDRYDKGKQLSAPESDIPTGRIVCEGAKISLTTSTLNARVVYTLDDMPLNIDSMIYPEAGMAFQAADSPVTIRAAAVSKENEISEEVVYQYTIVQPVQECLTEKGMFMQEVLPQYGVYNDPVLIKSCRRYKVTVGSGQKLNVTIHSKNFNSEVNLYDREDAVGMSVAQGGADVPVTWENKTEFDKSIWISVTARERTDKTDILRYDIEWYVESEEKATSDENESSTESNGGNTGDIGNSGKDEKNTKAHTDTKISEISSAMPESGTDEKNMLYTMKMESAVSVLAEQGQEEKPEEFPIMHSLTYEEEEQETRYKPVETQLTAGNLQNEYAVKDHNTLNDKTVESSDCDELSSEEATGMPIGLWILLAVVLYIAVFLVYQKNKKNE